MGLPFIHRHSTWGLRALRHIVEGAQLPTSTYQFQYVCIHVLTRLLICNRAARAMKRIDNFVAQKKISALTAAEPIVSRVKHM